MGVGQGNFFNSPPDQLRQYFTQLRQELGQRLVEKVFGSEDKPSKVSGMCLVPFHCLIWSLVLTLYKTEDQPYKM